MSSPAATLTRRTSRRSALVLSTVCALAQGCGDGAATPGGGDAPLTDGGTLASAKDITALSIRGINGTIDATAIRLTLPYGASLTALAPVITHQGADISPASEVAQDFTNPVVYTVTAADGSTKPYTVSVTAASLDGVIMHVDFEGQDVDAYARANLDWPDSQYFIGLSRCDIVADGAIGTRALQVTYPAGVVSPNNGGAQWITNLPASYDELYLSYRIKFLDPDGADPQSFEPTHGGKLPGLAGGTVPSGGTAAPSTGFSARMMWNEARGLRQYMYYVDKTEDYGDVWPYQAGGLPAGAPFQFDVDTWYQIEHRVVLNTPGMEDGLVQGWIDGQLYLDKTADDDAGLLFRPAGATWGIDRFFFSTFYGGSGSDYQTTHDNRILFDDFVIATQPITH